MAEHGFFRAPWRAGFEVEVVLGDLGENRFAEVAPMDIASPAYRQAVAAILRDTTGRPWSAPRNTPTKTGYYVLAEYDIDPVVFDDHELVAGVELVTPPLPLAEAEDLRFAMQEAIFEMDGDDNAEPSLMTDSLGWHVNVDPGEDHGRAELDPVRYSVFVDEVPMLLGSGRIGSRYTGLQRHAYGPALLKEMANYPAMMTPGVNMQNFMGRLCGASKTYAANFSRRAYTELRHYGVVDFMSDEPLEGLVGTVLHALEAQSASVEDGLEHHLSVFRTLADWFDGHRSRFSLHMNEAGRLTNFIHGEIFFDGEEVGEAIWDGAAEFKLWDDAPYSSLFGIRDHNMSDALECIAMLCLDAAEASAVAGRVPVRGARFKSAIAALQERLQCMDARPAPDPIGWWERAPI